MSTLSKKAQAGFPEEVAGHQGPQGCERRRDTRLGWLRQDSGQRRGTSQRAPRSIVGHRSPDQADGWKLLRLGPA